MNFGFQHFKTAHHLGGRFKFIIFEPLFSDLYENTFSNQIVMLT